MELYQRSVINIDFLGHFLQLFIAAYHNVLWYYYYSAGYLESFRWLSSKILWRLDDD